MRKSPAILILIVTAVFLFFLISCSQINNAGVSVKSNTEEKYAKDLIIYKIVENDGPNSADHLRTQVREFYDFTNIFFQEWNSNIEETRQIFEKFNNEDTVLKEKIIYSGMLLEKYETFYDKLERINPPPEVSKAYDYALNAVSKRILFFEEFKNGAEIDELAKIENDAYSYETFFWEEINRLYDYYLEKVNEKNYLTV